MMGSVKDMFMHDNDIFRLPVFCDMRADRLMKEWLKSMESEAAEEILEKLLTFMRFAFFFNYRNVRRNIDGFHGKYLFRSKDDKITVSAIFDDGKLNVSKNKIDDPDITVTFKNGRTLLNYLFSPKQDILGSILKQEVVPEGNLNYLYKFAYMAKRFQLMATGKA